MKLQKIKVENYRGFKDFELEFEPDCTILIGENNSGKSNVLAAIYANLRANRAVREGAFDVHDFHLPSPTALAGDAGPIRLTISFAERSEDEWDIQLVSLLEQVINFDPSHGTRSITIRVEGTPSTPTEESGYDWAFLDADGNPRSPKQIGLLNRLQSLRPLSTLDALRDSAKEFSQRSPYFGAFTRDPKFDDAVRDALLAALADINDQVLAAHAVFGVLKENLDAGQNVVQSTHADAAKIEAVPSRISDLLANSQVSFQNRWGVVLPLDRHGSGTQSLSVLSLFRAYVEARLLAKGEPLSEPILSLEEPESHLHPAGARALWSLLEHLPGQRIVTSHSGDLVGEAPLRCLRRIVFSDGAVLSRRINETKFDRRELEHLNFYIRLSRGELLFANAWILVEGKSEILLLNGISRAAKIDLFAHGIRVIEHAGHGGPVPFIKLADELGIYWHCLSDNDDAGEKYSNQARSELRGRSEADHITTLEHGKLEIFLCNNGFDTEYLSAVPTVKRVDITETPGTNAYFKQIVSLMHNTEKIPAILSICERINADPSCLPKTLRDVIDLCVSKAS